jgi:hypothetical protein
MENNIVEVDCYHDWSDWTTIEPTKINLDDYVYFSCEWRLGTWYIVVHWVSDKENYKWSSRDISDHGVAHINSLANFIIVANSYDKYQECKVSKFNSMHYEKSFYDELLKLLNKVKELEAIQSK